MPELNAKDWCEYCSAVFFFLNVFHGFGGSSVFASTAEAKGGINARQSGFFAPLSLSHCHVSSVLRKSIIVGVLRGTSARLSAFRRTRLDQSIDFSILSSLTSV